MLAWEGEGAWVLDHLDGEAWDRYNELPVTTDLDVHRENLKSIGATCQIKGGSRPYHGEVMIRVKVLGPVIS
ncbi:uncharacterized protein N7503_006148 [Penicillium pulvis]|uniref:uncharacterized protein n=1 Tax=Penicillium pulvis TaxID=1562058 RepID=UPI00254755DA|nr:uncharacterized protein N7503_006148 [Penicillium pulvis]KAJ5798643.1 hypothetical protein N7503_006148 [Penicillium pulvis]